MNEGILDFLLLRDPNVSWVLFGMIFISAAASLVGSFTFLQKRALVGDTISHAVLPGLCLAFLLTLRKDPIILLSGALVSGLIGLICVDAISRLSRIKADAALGIVLSVFYGLGIVLLTFIQRSGYASQSGLDRFLFGKAASLMREDVFTFGLVSLGIIVVVSLLFRPLSIMTFDRDHAKSIGIPVGRYDLILSFLTVIAIAVGIQAVGVVLMASLIIAPVVAARYWTHSLYKMIILAVIFAAISGITGSFISYLFPQMPTGPWVVIVLSLLAGFSILTGNSKGVLSLSRKRKRHQQKMLKENILKALYKLGEEAKDFEKTYSLSFLQQFRKLGKGKWKQGLKLLQKEGWISANEEEYQFTQEGIEEGKRVVRIHRLWELYLTTYAKLPADHVHEDAEAIEHIITPELEVSLMEALAFPLQDPHSSPIPYKKE